MPYLVISGECRILGTSPDGDSVRFYPDDSGAWAEIRGRYRVRRNAAGGAQLRLDGIDALETHYALDGGGVVSQPLGLANEAAAGLLGALGFARVERGGAGGETVVDVDPPAVRAYVLSRAADRNGRCVAFLGVGDPPAEAGSWAYVDGDAVRSTLNYGQLAVGAAYPTYYRGLFADLRATLTEAVELARPDRGLWPADRTQSGLEVRSLEQLEQDGVVLPKLFRRLATYLRLGDGDPSLRGFRDFLAQEDDRLFVLPEGHYTGLDSVVEVSDGGVRLTRPPEQLVFEEK